MTVSRSAQARPPGSRYRPPPSPSPSLPPMRAVPPRAWLWPTVAPWRVRVESSLRGGLGIALLDGGQDTGDVGHEGQHTARGRGQQHASGGLAPSPTLYIPIYDLPGN